MNRGPARALRFAFPTTLVGLAALFVLLTSSCGFTAVTWTSVANSPVTRTEAMAAVVGGRLYVLGGFQPSPFGPTKTVRSYDPATNTWATGADLPKLLTHTAVAVDGTSIYLAGGYVGTGGSGQVFGTTEVWRYDTVTGTSTPMPGLPIARGSGGLVNLNRVLHFFGGVEIPSRKDRGEHWTLDLNAASPTWQPAAPMPNPRSHMGYVALGGKIYAIGGQLGTDAALVAQTTVNVWDPASPGAWTTAAPLPFALSHISSSTFVLNHRIIVLGGEHGNLKARAENYAFDPLDGWTTLTSLPDTRYSAVGGTIGGNLYLNGGSDDGGPIQNKTWKGVPQGA